MIAYITAVHDIDRVHNRPDVSDHDSQVEQISPADRFMV